MQMAFLNLMKKPLTVVMQPERKVCRIPLFFQSPFCPQKYSDLPALSMLLLFYTRSTTASKLQGAWQGNQKGIPRMKLDALKDDFRAPGQEKRCNRFLANCFQTVELKLEEGKGGQREIHGFDQLTVSLLIQRGYIF